MKHIVEAGQCAGEALTRVADLMRAHREPVPAPVVETNPLAGKSLEDLLHPDVWVDGFTVAEIAHLTGRKPEEFESEVRALVNRGILRVALPSGALTRNNTLPRPDTFNIPTRSGGYKGFV